MAPAGDAAPGYRIVARVGLVGPERDAVEALAGRVAVDEGLVLPLNVAGPDPGGATQQLLAYAGDALVGFISFEELDGIEATGAVAPAARRRGIGRALVTAARADLRARGLPSFLLVCDEAAPAAAPFCAAIGARYRFSEYRMQLDEARVPPPRAWPQPLELRPATPADVGAIARVTAAAFGDREEETRERVRRRVGAPGQRYRVARLGDEPIGAIRTVHEGGAVYVASFAVAPARQGRGYGRQILARTVAALLAEPARPILLEVESDNRQALALYASCGFVTTQRYGYYDLAV